MVFGDRLIVSLYLFRTFTGKIYQALPGAPQFILHSRNDRFKITLILCKFALTVFRKETTIFHFFITIRNILMNKIAFNKSGEVRHLWKFLFTLIIILGFSLVLEKIFRQVPINNKVAQPVFCGIIVGTLISLKFVYKVSFNKLGVSLNSRNLTFVSAGTVIPFLLQLQFFLIDRYIFRHSFSFLFPELSLALLYSLVSYVIVAAAEELYFRVYMIGYFKDKFNVIYFFLFSAVTFSLLHALGLSSYNYLSFLAFLLAGIFYGLLYLLSNSFYLVLSAHAIHNTFLLYPVNDSNTKVYLINQIISITYILVLSYFYYGKKKLLETA